MVAAKRGAKSPRRASKGTPSKGEPSTSIPGLVDPVTGLVGPVGPEHGLNEFGGVFGPGHQPGITGMDGIEGVDVTKELSDAPIPTYTYVIVHGTLIGSVILSIVLVYYAELAGLAGF